MLPTVYRGGTAALAPLVRGYLLWRCRQGKEDRARLGERLGVAGATRPSGPLVWIHAASVGEAVSVLGLIARLCDERPGIEIPLLHPDRYG